MEIINIMYDIIREFAAFMSAYIGEFIAFVGSLVITWITLMFSKKQFKKQINYMEYTHRETLYYQEKHYEEQLKQQQEQVRLSVIPFFIIKEVRCSVRKILNEDFVSIEIVLKNIGRNVAVRVYTKTIEDNEEPLAICKTNTSYYTISQPISLYCNTINVDQECCFQVVQVMRDDFVKSVGEYYNDMSKCDEVTYELCFDDIIGNSYIQKFDFLLGVFDNKMDATKYGNSSPLLKSK